LITSGKLNLSTLSVFYEDTTLFFQIICIYVLVILPLLVTRWCLILIALETPLFFVQAVGIKMIGNFFNVILPGSISGDIVKAFYLNKVNPAYNKTKCVLSVLLDRILGMIGLLLLITILLGFSQELWINSTILVSLASTVISIIVVVCILMSIVFLPSRHFKKCRLLENLPYNAFIHNALEVFFLLKNNFRYVIGAISLSVCYQCTLLFLFDCYAKAIGIIPPPNSIHLLIIAIGVLTTVLPLAHFGVGHVAFAFLYETQGIQNGADIFNLFILVQLGFSCFGAIPFLLYSNTMNLGFKKVLGEYRD